MVGKLVKKKTCQIPLLIPRVPVKFVSPVECIDGPWVAPLNHNRTTCSRCSLQFRVVSLFASLHASIVTIEGLFS